MKARDICVVQIPYDTRTSMDDMIRRHARAAARRFTILGPETNVPYKVVRSIGSQLILERVFRQFERFLEVNKAGNLKNFPPEMVDLFILARNEYVGESQLKLDRWALEILLGRSIERIRSARPQQLKPRALSIEHIEAIIRAQRPEMAYSTQLAFACGLRSFELLTIAPPGVEQRDKRPIPPYLFFGAEDGELRTVTGKGGLVRWSHVPHSLLARLELTRRARPKKVRHQCRSLTSYYDIVGGQAWATDFSRTCRDLFGTSPGAHGLRHSYVQFRLGRLQEAGLSELQARLAVSVEIGHFRPEKTKTYTRGLWNSGKKEEE